MQQTKEDVTHDSHRRIDGQHYYYYYNVIGWKLNHFGMVNLTNILVDMCLTNILVK